MPKVNAGIVYIHTHCYSFTSYDHTPASIRSQAGPEAVIGMSSCLFQRLVPKRETRDSSRAQAPERVEIIQSKEIVLIKAHKSEEAARGC